MIATRSAVLRGPLIIPYLISSIVMMQCLPLSRWVAPKDTRAWIGYYILQVRADSTAAGRLPDVLRDLGPGVVSEYSSPVSFTAFDSSVTCLYADLPDRLVQQDPRFDPYIRDIGRYFRLSTGDAQWLIAYIPASRSGFALFARLAGRLGFPAKGQWRIIEFDLPEKILLIVAVLGFALALCARALEYRRETIAYSLAAAVLWLPWVVCGGIAELSLFYVLFLAWFSALRERLPFLRDFPSDQWSMISLVKTLKGYFLAAAIGAAVYLPITGLSIAGAGIHRLLGIAFASLSPVGLIMISAPRGGKRVVFRPIPIVSGASRALNTGPLIQLYVLASILIVSLATLLRSPVAPVPHMGQGGGKLGWEALQRARPGISETDMDRLPDISEYVTHIAYQQSLVFGRGYSFPARDERVYAREYIEGPLPAAIISRLRTVKVFNQAWLNGLIRAALPSSVERMLLDQGGVMSVSLESLRGVLAKDLVVAALLAMAFCWRLRPLIRGDIWRFNTARKDQVP